jgi:hypothetical protein
MQLTDDPNPILQNSLLKSNHPVQSPLKTRNPDFERNQDSTRAKELQNKSLPDRPREYVQNN